MSHFPYVMYAVTRRAAVAGVFVRIQIGLFASLWAQAFAAVYHEENLLSNMLGCFCMGAAMAHKKMLGHASRAAPAVPEIDERVCLCLCAQEYLRAARACVHSRVLREPHDVFVVEQRGEFDDAERVYEPGIPILLRWLFDPDVVLELWNAFLRDGY